MIKTTTKRWFLHSWKRNSCWLSIHRSHVWFRKFRYKLAGFLFGSVRAERALLKVKNTQDWHGGALGGVTKLCQKWCLSYVFERGSMGFMCFLTFSQILSRARSRPEPNKNLSVVYCYPFSLREMDCALDTKLLKYVDKIPPDHCCNFYK